MENKTLTLPNPATGQPMTTADVLSAVIQAQTAEGMTIGDMRERFGIVEKLAASNGTIELSNKELVIVKRIYRNHRFGQMHMDFVTVGDQLEEGSD